MASLRIACASSANSIAKVARPHSLHIVSAQASFNSRPRPGSSTAPQSFKKFFGGFSSQPSGGQKEYKVRAPFLFLETAMHNTVHACPALFRSAGVRTFAERCLSGRQGKYGDLIRRASFAMAGTQLAPTAAPEGQEIATFAGL